MPTRIGVISDTHGLLRPEAVEALAGVALIVHAGDIGEPGILEQLSATAPVHAIRGNVDTGQWALSLPETLVVEVEQTRLFVIHSLADLRRDPAAAGYRAVISGHSHKAAQSIRDGVLYLNPGSAGPRRFHLPVTLARIDVDGSELLHPELITLAV